VIAYCTAFENFLRDFLIEQAISQPPPLAGFVKQKVALTVSVPPPLDRDDVDQCLSSGRPIFQDVKMNGGAREIYRKMLGKQKDPFGAIATTVFSNGTQRKAAYGDICMLFEMRHLFIHRNGIVGARYQKDMNEAACRDRIELECDDSSPRYEWSWPAVR
jgi:hypothetical protein